MTTADPGYSSQVSNWNGSRPSRASPPEVSRGGAGSTLVNACRGDVCGRVALTGRPYTRHGKAAKSARTHWQEGMRWEAGLPTAAAVPSPLGPRPRGGATMGEVDLVALYWTVSGPVEVHFGREWST